MSSAEFELRAHDSVFDRLDRLADAAITDDLRSTAIALLRQVMDSPDSCRLQAIRWPRAEFSGYRVSAMPGPYEVQAWWSFVEGASYVWGLTLDPELSGGTFTG